MPNLRSNFDDTMIMVDGDPLPPAEWFRRVENFINENNWTVAFGNIEFDGEQVVLYINNSSGSFSGTAYVSGVKTTGLSSDSTKPWIRVNFSDNTATEQAGPPPDPFPDDEEWFLKTQTFGDIHVTRAG